jgi:hypothetical protein
MADDNSYTQPKPTSNVHGKVWEVVKASTKDFDGIIGQGKERRFGKRTGAFVTRDPKLAKEINEKYGYSKNGSRDVVVVERDEYAAPTRKNLHVVPAMPWHEEDE